MYISHLFPFRVFSADGDPHFVIDFPSSKFSVCFNIDGEPGDILRLVSDHKESGEQLSKVVPCEGKLKCKASAVAIKPRYFVGEEPEEVRKKSAFQARQWKIHVHRFSSSNHVD